MLTFYRSRLIAVTGACLSAAISFTGLSALTPDEYQVTGEVTDRIESAHSINNYQYLSRQFLLLTEGSKRHYLLNLGETCLSPMWAENINISKSNDTIHAGFDYVSTDGARCDIGEIREISNEEMQAIYWAEKV